MDILERAKSTLVENGHKLTVPRKIMLDFLSDEMNKHLTCEEIYDRLNRQNANVGIATVYRNMQLFEDLGIASKLQLEDGVARYELNIDHDEHQHHHLVCLKCYDVIEVEDDLLGEIEREIETKYDFQISDHVLKFYGTCSKCKEGLDE